MSKSKCCGAEIVEGPGGVPTCILCLAPCGKPCEMEATPKKKPSDRIEELALHDEEHDTAETAMAYACAIMKYLDEQAQ